ncbi:hypothetical protein [Alcaligenes faecalis]|uniref:hypothetical protein n=1 Tax=Alcaligenes faecalis TaxID=511 RepID=UPI001C9A7F91|nr:hypothetical protein [Alcaligenes faecalis]MBY6309925.1 hypothetical protein [Alcaligenes faecalis]MBY6315951.1 hypothetical protein [Alcaligenes faecalis]MBY6390842.1 hypothetical protein [Alcaligenes faecalis]
MKTYIPGANTYQREGFSQWLLASGVGCFMLSPVAHADDFHLTQFGHPIVEQAPSQNYQKLNKISTSISTWDKPERGIMPLETTALSKEYFSAAVEDIWEQVERGEFSFSEGELDLARRILSLNPHANI